MIDNLKDSIHIQKLMMPDDDKLLEKGEFLTEKEFKNLVDGVFKRLNKLIEIYNEKGYLTWQVIIFL
jgi:hypothetical protein